MPSSRRILATLAIAAVACGQPTASGPSAEPVEDPVRGPDYMCGSIGLSPDVMASAPPATELGEEGRAALDGMEVPPIDPAAGWLVVAEGPDELSLIRDLDEPFDNGPGDLRTHEFVAVSWLTEVSDGPGWYLDAAGLCALRRDLPDGLAHADLLLDPDQPLDPDAESVHLLVIERECASGQHATGRVEVVEQRLTADQLQLQVGVRPVEGGADCQGNPPTPIIVELAQPLGDRVPVDVSVLPPRALSNAGEPTS